MTAISAVEISDHILDTFTDIVAIDDRGDTLFYVDPDLLCSQGLLRSPGPWNPFATLVTSDGFDRASNLSRPGVYRLNAGIGAVSFQALFGTDVQQYDFMALDQIMPHPVFGDMDWICIQNPGPEKWATIRRLLADAHETAIRQMTDGGNGFLRERARSGPR